jgi:hypothetical protein
MMMMVIEKMRGLFDLGRERCYKGGIRPSKRLFRVKTVIARDVGALSACLR